MLLTLIMRTNRKAKLYIRILFKNAFILLILSTILGNLHIKYYETQENYVDKEKIEINCVILSEPNETQYYWVYEVRAENGKNKGKRLLLKVKKQKENIKLEYGSKFSVNGIYRRSQGQRNEYGFDYDKYLKSKGIYGSIITQKSRIVLKQHDTLNPILKSIHNVKQSIAEKLNSWLTKENSSLIIGILLGDKTYLSDETIDNFSNSNLSHLLVVSGAHISYLILGLSVFLTKINIGKKKTYIFTIIVLLFFAIMVGTSPSVVRATTMGIIILIGKLIYEKPDFLTSMAISIIIILLNNPYSILDIGLQLSYLATLGIILFYPIISSKLKTKNSKIKYIKELISISISAQILIIPIVMLNFHKLSLNFIISNVLAPPLFGVSIIYGSFTLIIGSIFNPIGQVLSILLNIDLQILNWITKTIGSFKTGNILMIRAGAIFILTYYMIFFTVIWIYNILYKNKKFSEMTNIERKQIKILRKLQNNKYKYLKILTIALILILIIRFFINTIIPQNLKINFIDVGQGDACLIQTPYHKKILIDGGGSSDESSYDVGKNVLVPYLLNKQIKTIHYIIISHFDSDHVKRSTYSYGRIKS